MSGEGFLGSMAALLSPNGTHVKKVPSLNVVTQGTGPNIPSSMSTGGIRRVRSSVVTGKISRTRSHTIAIGSVPASPGIGRQKLTLTQEQFVRCTLVIVRSHRDRMVASGKDYVANLMRNKEYYSNILAKLYLEEIRGFWDDFHSNVGPDLRQLGEISKRIPAITNELDRLYTVHHEYLPLRIKVEERYRQELTRFSDLYCVSVRGAGNLISEASGKYPQDGHDIARMVRRVIFRNLVETFTSQLETLPPFSGKFAESKNKVKTMKKLMLGLTDFDYFRHQYGESGGGRNYMSAFSKSVEAALKSSYKRNGSSIVKEGTFHARQVQLTHNLWKLYVSTMTAEEIMQRFSVFHYSPPLPQELSGEADIDAYLDYAIDPIESIEQDLEADFNVSSREDEVKAYLLIVKDGYVKMCGEIIESIEVIVPLINCLTEPTSHRGSKTKKRYSLSPASLTAFQDNMREIYSKLSVILANVKSQKRALDQILAPETLML